jgi:hypothetical protein
MEAEIYNFIQDMKDKYDVEITVSIPSENEIKQYDYEEFYDLWEEE